MTPVAKLACPECHSTKLHKQGLKWSGRQQRQRYQCAVCGRQTIAPVAITATKKTKAKAKTKKKG